MRVKLINILILSFSLSSIAHADELPKNQNYIVKTSPRVEIKKGEEFTSANSVIQIDYIDGLGNLKQTVYKEYTPLKSDLIEYKTIVNNRTINNAEYRTYRPVPIVANSGKFQTEDVILATGKDYYQDEKPYSLDYYEMSLNNRLQESYGAGKDWHSTGHSVKHGYKWNETNSVKRFTATSDSLECKEYYPAGTLYQKITTDEDGKTVESFSDIFGKKILERAGDDHDTYYVYDNFDKLSYVLPPMASDAFIVNSKMSKNHQTLKNYAFIYKYDGLDRCIEKKLPGADFIYYMYDESNVLICSQNGEQRKKNLWAFNIPDQFGRVVVTGICKNPVLSGRVRAKIEMYQSSKYDTKYVWDNLNIDQVQIYTINYYDNYNVASTEEFKFKNDQPGYERGNPSSAVTRLTGTRVKQLNGSEQELVEAIYYDIKGNVIQTRSNKHLGGYDYKYFNYNFANQQTSQFYQHFFTDAFMTMNGPVTWLDDNYQYEYDHAGRLLKTKLNGVVIEENNYNEIGLLQNRKKGNDLLSTDYAYNVRGWTKSLNESKTGFSQTLYYQNGGRAACYNGNISQIDYSYGNNQGYNLIYTYDKLNRLDYSYGIDKKTQTMSVEEGFTYDKHGNPANIFRMLNSVVTDALSINYKGNQMLTMSNEYADNNGSTVTEYPGSNSTFAYDANGSLTSDTGRGIATVRYNSLCLPDTIQFRNGNAIYYTYAADGQKLRVSHITAKPGVVQPVSNGEVRKLDQESIISRLTTDYVDNYIYENGDLKKVLFPGGYTEYTTMYADQIHVPRSYYYNTDYIGNNRDVVDGNGTIVQLTEYSAFGTPFPNIVGDPGVQPYKYSGKEFDQMHGLNWYDFSARMYDPILGRFNTIDPLAEKYYSISPYAYCANNPVLLIDPNGMEWFYYSVDGKKDPTWNWRDESKYHTGIKNEKGEEVVLTGHEAVVTFNGAIDEKLGKGQNMFGEGAKLADVSVYGPNGKNDIKHYKGYTMSSDPTKFGIVKNGDYTVNRLGSKERKGPYGSDLVLENRNAKIPEQDNFNPAFPRRNPAYLQGVFIHRSNNDGWAGTFFNTGKWHGVSQGCLLIAPNQWNAFTKQLNSVNSFLLQIIRK